MIESNRRGEIGYNAVWVIVVGLIITATFGLTAGGAMIQAANMNGITDINTTVIGQLTPYNKVNTTLSDMKSSFIDENGNAKTGVTDVLNALYTGAAGMIGIIFQSITGFIPIGSAIGNIMHIPSQVVNVAIFFVVLIAVVGVTFLIRRL